MSEPNDPPTESAESGAESSVTAPEQPAATRHRTLSLTLARLWGRVGWRRVARGFAGALLLVIGLVALVVTGPLWAPLLPWAARTEPSQPAAAADAALRGLDRRVAALEARPTASASDLARIREEVTRLAGSVADLATRITAIDKTVHSQTAGDPTDIALVLALLQIRDAVEAGRPFAAAYEALVALAQARPEIAAAAAPLAEPAATGLPGRSVLANRLRELADAIARADATPSATADTNAALPDWASQAWRRLSGVVTIRRIDGGGQGQPGGGPAEAVNGALQKLAGGDIEGAVGALDPLTGAPAETIRPWLRMAKERLAAEAALRQIEALLVARIGTPANASAGPGPTR